MPQKSFAVWRSKAGEPLVITQNGEAKVVMKDIESYEQQQETIALLKILALGTRQIEEGKIQPAALGCVHSGYPLNRFRLFIVFGPEQALESPVVLRHEGFHADPSRIGEIACAVPEASDTVHLESVFALLLQNLFIQIDISQAVDQRFPRLDYHALEAVAPEEAPPPMPFVVETGEIDLQFPGELRNT
jgi:prevent-host-death family protein